MTAPELRPFGDEFVALAGRLLAERHRRHRRVEPLLPSNYEDPAAAEEEVAALWSRPEASGSAAFTREGELAGYLIGTERSSETWGPCVWVEFAGQATVRPPLIRELYGAAAQRWVDEGRSRHYVFAPAHDDELLAAWFSVGFGQQQAHGIRPIPRANEIAAPTLALREATADDVDALLRVGRLLPEHHCRSPVFSTVPAESADDPDGWLADVLDPRIGILLAERDGEVVGAATCAPTTLSHEHSGLARPDGSCLLAFAATDPAVRGSGVGTALTRAVLGWAAHSGYDSIVTDWRVTNLQSARFWPGQGFRETFLRLYRSIP